VYSHNSGRRRLRSQRSDEAMLTSPQHSLPTQTPVPVPVHPGEDHIAETRVRTRRFAKSGLVLADATMVALALITAYQQRGRQGSAPDLDGVYLQHLILGIGAVPAWIVVFARRRLYQARFFARRVDEIRRVVLGSASVVLGMAAVGYWLQLDVSRGWLVLAGLFASGAVIIEREVARVVFRTLRSRGRLLRRVVIVGCNDEALELAAMLTTEEDLGYRVVGFVDDRTDSLQDLLGTVDETIDVVHRMQADCVLVATTASSATATNRLVRDLLHAGIHVEISSTLRDVDAERLTVRPLGPYPVAYLEPRLTNGWRSLAKRSFDVTVAAIALFLTAPVAIAVAIAIKVDTTGPMFFRQTRVGKDGRQFRVWKFRTMVADAEKKLIDLREHNEADGPLFKLKEDPRVTRVGRILRKTSLDELPQLLNVLAGEMSLVGPRPALPSELTSWDKALHARLRVRPGITGMWQVHGRSDASFEAYSRLDLYYVDNWSLLTDLSILGKTVPTVLFGRGAY
jgi:exopolysaccharide biosynthesis polyprenyl glycosylphosphotransferase